MSKLKGRIYKVLSGFYYIESAGQQYQTRARGNFRKQGLKPIVGDEVEFVSHNLTDGMVTKILPRKNSLQRPPVANIDQVVIVMSAVHPKFSPALLDRFIVQCEAMKMHPILYWTKMDQVNDNEQEELKRWRSIYESIGYPVFFGEINQLPSSRFIEQLKDKTTVLMGQSGVGKSTLINNINPQFHLETGEISTSLGRGRHTTRHVELLKVCDGFLADTPGFSALEIADLSAVELADDFIEFRPLAKHCRFRGCLHHNEPDCAVKEAVENGEVCAERYDHYLLMLSELQNRRPQYNKRKKSE